MNNEGELELKKKFEKIVENDFQILPEVRGNHLIEEKEVIIDYMLYPKPHLIEVGFDPVWFGVEIKHFGIPGETGKMSRLLWQCITYQQSEFYINSENIRPTFVLAFSDVEEVNKGKDANSLSQWAGMLRLAGLPHIGIFEEKRKTKTNPTGGWGIRISSSTYFSFSRGQYKRLKNYNIFKVNIGNC